MKLFVCPVSKADCEFLTAVSNCNLTARFCTLSSLCKKQPTGPEQPITKWPMWWLPKSHNSQSASDIYHKKTQIWVAWQTTHYFAWSHYMGLLHLKSILPLCVMQLRWFWNRVAQYVKGELTTPQTKIKHVLCNLKTINNYVENDLIILM